MAKTEDIEAKLAAYVDDDLDAPARAEIEKHLATNPTHRQLIDELIKQRQLLRNLPKEAAPSEVAEAINAQLERAVLLGDVDGDADAAMYRIGPWSHIRAIAAVLLLTASLAGVIFYLLPGSGSKPPSLALNFAPPESGAQLSTTPEPVESPVALSAISPRAEAIAAAMPQPAPGATPSTTPTALADAMPTGAASDVTRSAPVVVMGDTEKAVNQIFNEVVQPRVGSLSLNTPAPPVVYVMPTNNPEATNHAVTQYLLSNNIPWESRSNTLAPEPPLAQGQMALGDRLMVQQPQMKQAAPMAEADRQQQAQSQQPYDARRQYSQERLRMAESNRAGGAMPVENQIVAKQVTQLQAAELRAALDAMRLRSRTDADAQTPLTIAATPINGNSQGSPESQELRRATMSVGNASQNEPPATPLTDAASPPATLPADAQLSLAPSNIRPQGAESVSLGQSLDSSARGQPNAQPTAQPGLFNTAVPATEPADAARVDFVIVVKPEAEAPATQPTTEPAPGN